MPATRGDVTVATLVKIALALVIVWLAIEILQELVGFLWALFHGVVSVLGVVLALVLLVMFGFWTLEALDWW